MPVTALRRLHEETLVTPGAAAAIITWQATGERASLGPAGRQAALHLVADVTVPLECQRCLQAVEVPLHIDRRLFFVEGEDAAAALDAESEQDVLALSRALDLPGLLEDELLLALPIVPRHEHCPQPLAAASAAAEVANDDAEPAENPFAVLAALKRGGLPN